MRFLTREELYLRRGQDEVLRLAGRVDGEPALARIDAAIDAAEAEAVSYLLGRYSNALPTMPAATPPVLKDKVATLAHRHLAGMAGALQVAPTLQAEADAARAWLSLVSRGVAQLDLPGQPPVDRTTARVLVSTDRRRSALTFEDLEGW
jgi:phage gp36-like protein